MEIRQIILIILYMLRVIIFACACVGVWSANEPTNFDYSSHGDDWSACPKNASKQSPILLTVGPSVQKTKDSYLFGDFSSVAGVANYLNTTIYINTTDSFGSLHTRLLDGVSLPFKANQIRLRMHSQHKTEDGYFDLQIQIFHVELYPTSRNYRLAVGLLFNVGPTPDPFVQEIIDGYGQNSTAANIKVDMRHLIPTNVADDFWFYLGSATIPPCTNAKLNWIISRKVNSITQLQKDKLTQILSQGKQNWEGNWRNIQALNSNPLAYRNVTDIFKID